VLPLMPFKLPACHVGTLLQEVLAAVHPAPLTSTQVSPPALMVLLTIFPPPGVSRPFS
jgi:hypothetical protein